MPTIPKTFSCVAQQERQLSIPFQISILNQKKTFPLMPSRLLVNSADELVTPKAFVTRNMVYPQAMKEEAKPTTETGKRVPIVGK